MREEERGKDIADLLLQETAHSDPRDRPNTLRCRKWLCTNQTNKVYTSWRKAKERMRRRQKERERKAYELAKEGACVPSLQGEHERRHCSITSSSRCLS
jgi:hypothetical protein